ncbi:MAG: outer membrane beta-barrel protein [Ferruginibacter sp.]
MNKKPFEHIEDKIKEAAESYQPPYQEEAWDKMNALLDKEEGKKRRVIFWWMPVLLLLLAGGGYWYFNKDHKKENIASAPVKQNATGTTTSGGSESPGTSSSQTQKHLPASSGQSRMADNTPANTATPITGAGSTIKGSTINPSAKTGRSAAKRVQHKGKLTSQAVTNIETLQDEMDESKENNEQPDITTAINKPGNKNEINNTVNKKTDSLSNSNKNIITPNTIAVTEKKNEKPVETKKQASKKTNENSKLSRFYFIATLGAEAASVKFLSFENSKLAPSYGIGIGYQLSKHLSVQTGFYAGPKKYIAGHGDYHPKAGSYWSQVYIKKVDANCMVFEIPIAVNYSFLQRSTTSWFVTGGISSYIMKKEQYKYEYMRNYTPYSGAYNYTGNKNLFSVITLAAGFEKSISKKFALRAGPTIGIPISGVGEGSIKLFSAGLHAGIRFQPPSKK